MTEYEFYSLGYESMQALQTEETTFLTILFGYLLTSHFLGAKVSIIQLTVFNTIYIVLMSGLSFNMWIHWGATVSWFRGSGNSSPLEAITNGNVHMIVASLMHVSLLIASLYFMWSVRHSKTV